MSANVGLKSIVKEGLILGVDAANYKSYTSGSSNWTDMVNGFSGIISGPVTYSNDNIPALVYTSNAWVYIPNKPLFDTLLNNFTILGWINPRQYFSGARVFGLGYASQWQFELRGGSGQRLSINYSKLGVNYFQALGPYIGTNSWQQVGFVMNNSVVNYIYNGQISALGSFTVSGDFVNNSQNYSIGNYGSGVDGQFPGSIANHQVYNRPLSAAEILQNYNAQKSRFGL